MLFWFKDFDLLFVFYLFIYFLRDRYVHRRSQVRLKEGVKADYLKNQIAAQIKRFKELLLLVLLIFQKPW